MRTHLQNIYAVLLILTTFAIPLWCTEVSDEYESFQERKDTPSVARYINPGYTNAYISALMHTSGFIKAYFLFSSKGKDNWSAQCVLATAKV